MENNEKNEKLTNNENSTEESLDTYVKMSMEAGVAPIELRFTQINDVNSKKTIALRSKAVINSVLLGKLENEQYESAMTLSAVGEELSKWGLRETVRLVSRMEKANREIDFVSFYCPPSILVRNDDIYSFLQQEIASAEIEHPAKICLEFPNTLLLENLKKVRQALLDLKLLGVTILMDGCAADNCPINSLVDLPVDYVILDESVNNMIKSGKKTNVTTTLIQYIKSMETQAIVGNITSDDEIKKLNPTEFYGYIPSELYVGEGAHGIERTAVVTSISEDIPEF